MEHVSNKEHFGAFGSFYQKHRSFGEPCTSNYFIKLRISKVTAYRVIKNVYKSKSFTGKSGSGRKAVQMAPNQAISFKMCQQENQGVSQPKAALEYGVNVLYHSKTVRFESAAALRGQKRVPGSTGKVKENAEKNMLKTLKTMKISFFAKGDNPHTTP